MAVRKIAISVPDHVLAQVDAAAAERGENRSRFITQMLVLLARARSDREISRRVDAVFADPEVAGEQRKTARASARVLARVVKGNRW
jgi:metal-responsive CopG/Arc/MetJ family transcriptional regulator